MKKKILILAGYYFPSVKAGGPVQSIKNLVDFLGDDFEFYILANDRDIGDEKPFESIVPQKWLNVDKAKVMYINYKNISGKFLSQLISKDSFDVLYINSVFDIKISIIPLVLYKLKKIHVNKVIIAPRGNFSEGAFKLKNTKKKIFLRCSKLFSLFNNIVWHATSKYEKKDIERYIGKNINVNISNNLTANYTCLRYSKKINKEPGKLKIIFLSRIHSKKNLDYALDLLRNLKGDVEFNIWGPIEDELYWNKCKKIIKELPINIMVKYNGIIEHDQVLSSFNKNHILLFPTRGENFGHIISEALIGGCPIVISDQTPWRNLKENIGWDIPLNERNKYIEVLQKYIDLNNEDYLDISKRSFEYGIEKSNSQKDIESYISLFN